MLTTLRIKNLALAADLTLELRPGYNVITGETGAGKSILIGALNLALGERADRTLLRSGCDSCTVEAVFDITRLRAPLTEFLEANGLEPCAEGQLILKRVFTAAGANRQFINGSPATLNTLATLGQWLVDIHGPHEHQSLLHPTRQLAILDAFGGLENEREAFAELLRRREALEAEKAALIVDERTYAQQLDLLRFQTREIAAAQLRPDEESELVQEHHRAANAARLLELSRAALDALAESDTAVLTQAGTLGRLRQELHRLDPATAPLLELHARAVETLHELLRELSRYADRVDLDPARLQQLEQRLNLLQSLKRKYGPTLADVIAFGEEAQRKLQALESRDAELARLNAALETTHAELWRVGRALSARRRKIIPRLAHAVRRELADLGFARSDFEIALTTLEETGLNEAGARLASHGLDTVEFLFAPNPGEPAKPLRAIASSGEIARVMLALKTVLAAQDDVPVLVFDEVDANIGGETATTVGRKLKHIAANRQVLCITHLPQVAAPADAHFVVTKRVEAGRTVSEVSLLDRAGRVAELTRMLGGGDAAARRHAEALLR
ncbi:MAG: DNA repair protein RecN [Verrucomicrobiales bacterium]|nr:DNA repair protein RecN [Verrucomicrobiales bacterium]